MGSAHKDRECARALPEASQCALRAVRFWAAAAYGLQVLHSGSVSNLVRKVWMNAAAVSKIFSAAYDLEKMHVGGSIACGGWRRSWF